MVICITKQFFTGVREKLFLSLKNEIALACMFLLGFFLNFASIKLCITFKTSS